MATTEKFYIGNLADATTLNTDGTWEQQTPDTTARVFTTRQDAFNHIDNLADGSYNVYSHIVKTS